MRIVKDFPYNVHTVEHEWIPMDDGVRLSARLWIPEVAFDQPVPAILEYIPYRKRDRKRLRDEQMHGWFAGHGYACVRVDIRGSGESEGVLKDEYLQSELDDGLTVLRWIAEQDWCDGHIGMIGISWGGFNSLQIAALQPPHLKAVISVASTDDRYADDIHHMGGCLLGENLAWASVMFDLNSLPPDPEIVGERWRAMWFERLENSGLWLQNWLEHQRRDEYWKHGSVCENYDHIRCPVMVVSGWADGYSNTVFRLLTHLKVPRQGLIGPWSHLYPHLGKPGPAIGFLQESKRWWDQWLKGEDSGITEEPMLRAFMQDSVKPSTTYTTRRGYWLGEYEWPSPRIEPVIFFLGRDRLIHARDKETVLPEALTIQSPLSVGMFSGKWYSNASAPDMPYDQRQEDGGALVFDSPPLEEDLEILGAPTVNLELSANRPVAMIAIRLSDVHPDGKATRVTYGLLNLTHRNSSEDPEKLVPTHHYRVKVRLNEIAQRFPRGHQLRLSISSSYWPLAWPPPRPTRLTIYTGASSLAIPSRPLPDEGESIAFAEPEMAPGPDITWLETEHHNLHVLYDLASDTSTVEVIGDKGEIRFNDINLTVSSRATETFRFKAGDFNSATGETLRESTYKRENWIIRTRTRMKLTSDESNFYINAELDAFQNENRVFSRNWDVTIRRDFV